MEEFETRKKKKFTPSQALLKAEHYCAYQERCQQEVRDKLYEWGLFPDAVESIIAKLITDNFLNEERFAKAYAGGKFRIKKWGRIKIKLELKKRSISDYCIKKAIQEIDEDSYLITLKQLIEKKSKEIKDKKEHTRKMKLANYIASRGFETDLIWEILNEPYR
ncbi:MAG TPA: RecX family transcriptional regulator [Bacteroidia bacterium]|nr:RecX family transcriptional regulator [Bacteroidia bacterium]